MSLGNSNMAVKALGMVLSLLILTSIIQGLQTVELFHYEKMEAVVGQNISLPCIAKTHADLRIVSIEWSKKTTGTTKLALHSPAHGSHIFWHNITIQIEKNDAKKVMGSYLHLPAVKKWDDGTYICDITTFPFGAIRAETQLIIREDIKIICDVNGTVEVQNGENLTIHCRSLPNAKYSWTKNNKLLSENESLELWWVTDAHEGSYKLTVNIGTISLHEEFAVTVITPTTSLKAVSPQGLTESADTSVATSPTPAHSTYLNLTTIIDANIPNTTNVTITTVDHIISSTNSTHVSVTLSPTTQSYTQDLLNSTTSSYASTALSSTQKTASDEMRNKSKPYTLQPDEISSMRAEESSITENVSENPERTTSLIDDVREVVRKDDGTVLLLVLIIVSMLVLIAVFGLLYRRQVIKKRMDLPPSFKPPPPPVKYARHSETISEIFPISRCNSVEEP